MSRLADELYGLLPAVIRIRDAERGSPLRELVAVIAEQGEHLRDDLDQLYDDQFIETCAEWVVPYLGDLVGNRALHCVVPGMASRRAEVAHTIAYRRRKGTALMLEQLAVDVTGWPAVVVEYFERLATTQYMNHLRPHNLAWADLRDGAAMEDLGSAFERSSHTLDVRRIASRRGRYNIPNIGIVLWRLASYSHRDSPLQRFHASDPDDRRFLILPLGCNTTLFPHPDTVPRPISRRRMEAHLGEHYGAGGSLVLRHGEILIPPECFCVCHLGDVRDATGAVTGWAHDDPGDRIALDPELGRLVIPDDVCDAAGTPIDPDEVRVSFHYGFSADRGGGPYDRYDSIDQALTTVQRVAPSDETAALQAQLVALDAGDGAVELVDNGRYEGTVSITTAVGQQLELRAANRQWPTLVLTDPLTLQAAEGSSISLNGLRISGAGLTASGGASAVVLSHWTLRLCHCTLVPGLTLSVNGDPLQPNAPSLVIDVPGEEVVEVEISHSIVGSLLIAGHARVTIRHSLVDATTAEGIAYSAPDGESAGGALRIENSTVIGRVHALTMEASNTIFVSQQPVPSGSGEVMAWEAPVLVERRQEGCVRYSYVPLEARVPRRYRCQPTDASHSLRMKPQFTSLRYGEPGYGQLSQRCAVEIRRGADDEAEMGVFHDLYQPQREINLRVRLEEYLRFGLEAGVFYAS